MKSNGSLPCYNDTQLDHSLIHFNPGHILAHYLFNFHFNIILPSKPCSPTWSLSFCVQTKIWARSAVRESRSWSTEQRHSCRLTTTKPVGWYKIGLTLFCGQVMQVTHHIYWFIYHHIHRMDSLCSPFISRCYTLLKYYLPASLKRLLLLFLPRGDVTQDFHTFRYRVTEKVISYCFLMSPVYFCRLCISY